MPIINLDSKCTGVEFYVDGIFNGHWEISKCVELSDGLYRVMLRVEY